MFRLKATAFNVSRTALNPAPIEPSWIKEGNPVARSVTISESPDLRVRSGLWECTAGRFRWHFQCDEIVHIIEGEVIVTYDGERHYLVPGSVCYFPHGLDTVWEVPKYVKKHFVTRLRPFQRVRRVIDFGKRGVAFVRKRVG